MFNYLQWGRRCSAGALWALAVWGVGAGAQTTPPKAAAAAAGAPAGVPVVSQLWHVDYDVAADGKSSVAYATQHQVAHASALERMKSFSFSYSAGIQTAQILEAYTLKADGRRIPVPPTNYQTVVSDGRDGAKPLFSDRTRISVVFPDLAVGDSVGMRYRIDDKEPIFPGAFSVVQGFSPYGVHEDSRVTIRAPKGLNLRFEAHGLQEQPPVQDGDATVRQWRYQNTTPKAWDEADAGIWRLDESPVLLASTFADYESIARAYGERALPKARPTPRIEALAQSIVGAQTDPRERARLLYEWVSTQITYGGNCIGVGAVVPRDVDVVLDNKMGDCKDHATLLQALLTAVGVRSEQVLINAGELYDLPTTPVVSTVNHVINYLPDFKMYLDATAKQVPFGYLPGSAYAKPVIHVGADKALASIPPGSADLTEQRAHTSIQIAADGSAKGSLKASFKGLAAAQMRSYMADLQGDGERDFVRNMLASGGFKGQGVLDRGDLAPTKELSDSYSFSITFEIAKYLQAGKRGAFVLAPVLNLPMGIARLAEAEEKHLPRRRTGCYGYHSYETYDVELGAGVAFNRVPPNLQTRNQALNYSATYQRTTNGYKVSREVHDTTPQGLCTPEYAAQWNNEVKPIAQNLQSQIFYQRGEPAKGQARGQAKGPQKGQVKGQARGAAKGPAKAPGKVQPKKR